MRNVELLGCVHGPCRITHSTKFCDDKRLVLEPCRIRRGEPMVVKILDDDLEQLTDSSKWLVSRVFTEGHLASPPFQSDGHASSARKRSTLILDMAKSWICRPAPSVCFMVQIQPGRRSGTCKWHCQMTISTFASSGLEPIWKP